MKASFTIENLGCAKCAMKMERKISDIEGVRYASVIFMSKKLIVDADEKEMTRIEEAAATAVRSVERDARLVRR